MEKRRNDFRGINDILVNSILKGFFLAFVFLTLLLAEQLSAQLPSVSSGTLRRHGNFPSKFIPPRHVDVWLPEGYSDRKKYNVLYMHDGQMLFDSTVTWNKQAWDADDAITGLLLENKIRDLIVVGIWNGGVTRHMEYFPQKPFDMLTSDEKAFLLSSVRGTGIPVFSEKNLRSDQYLKFLVQELKPFIDSVYTVHADREHTFIAGSSMGGLISLYALCEYPEVFGGAACLSTHWPGIFTMENNPFPGALLTYLQTKLPTPGSHRIYFDYGTATLDSLYAPLQKKVDAVMRIKGYKKRNWITRVFPQEDHSENAWKRRFHIPIVFLLGNR